MCHFNNCKGILFALCVTFITVKECYLAQKELRTDKDTGRTSIPFLVIVSCHARLDKS